jgi:hypothetical protein
MMTYRVDPERSQWLTEEYECRCYRFTYLTSDGGILTSSYCCRECRSRGEYLMQQEVLALVEEAKRMEHKQDDQLSIEMNGIVDAPPPPST